MAMSTFPRLYTWVQPCRDWFQKLWWIYWGHLDQKNTRAFELSLHSSLFCYEAFHLLSSCFNYLIILFDNSHLLTLQHWSHPSCYHIHYHFSLLNSKSLSFHTLFQSLSFSFFLLLLLDMLLNYNKQHHFFNVWFVIVKHSTSGNWTNLVHPNPAQPWKIKISKKKIILIRKCSIPKYIWYFILFWES